MIKYVTVAVIALFVSAALAEEASNPAAAPTPSAQPAQAQPTKFYLEVDPADLAAISTALNELPKKIADPLILKLNGQLQAQEQLKAAADKVITDATEKAKKRK